MLKPLAICHCWLLFVLLASTVIHAAEAAPRGDVPRPAKVPGLVLVVCPTAWQPTLAPWIKHRTAQGWQVQLLPPAATAAAQTAAIQQIHARTPLTAVLLIGDAVTTDQGRQPLVATHQIKAQVITRWQGEPLIASDLPYADPDQDGVPELALGRWPADNAQQLQTIVAKTLAYEQSQDFGPWRAKINLVAGIGGFGALTDAAIEQGARTIVLSGLPASYEPTLTFGSWTSPHCPDPRRFAEQARSRLAEGCLFWVYIGHGQPRGLDWIRMPDRKSYEIMECRDCAQLLPVKTAPLAMFLACSTGAFDKPEDCLAEDLLRAEQGPVAIMASSRVAMPYGLSVFASEALRAGLVEQTDTLGEIVRLAKVRSLAAPLPTEASPVRNMLDSIAGLLTPGGHDSRLERSEHAHLLQLFGDPCLTLKHPETVKLSGPATAKAGSSVQFFAVSNITQANNTESNNTESNITVSNITGSPNATDQTRVSSPVRWELRMPPGRLKQAARPREHYQANEEQWREMQQTYEATFDTVVLKNTHASRAPWQTTFVLPADARGEYQIRLWSAHATGYQVGTHKLLVE